MANKIITLNLCELIGIEKGIITYEECGKFTGGLELYDTHEVSCCEMHYLDWQMEDIPQDNSKFETDNFKIEKIEDYGIALIPINGHKIRIPGYSYNNGYYSDNLTLVFKYKNKVYELDITECQTSRY